MDHQLIQSIVEQVLQRLQLHRENEPHIPIAISARHVHLSQKHVEILFGEGYALTPKVELSQPGQFAAEETITIAGPKGCIERVRILGPARDITQVEVSQTDAFKLGIDAPLRLSGDIEGSASCTIIGPKESLFLHQGLIIANRHIHMSPEDALRFSVKNGEKVQVRTISERPITYHDVLIRVSPKYSLEMHIDTDEGNSAFLKGSGVGIIMKVMSDLDPINVQQVNRPEHLSLRQTNSLKPYQEKNEDERLEIEGLGNKKTIEQLHALFPRKVVTERDIRDLTTSTLVITKKTIITPLARDAAREKQIEIQVEDD